VRTARFSAAWSAGSWRMEPPRRAPTWRRSRWAATHASSSWAGPLTWCEPSGCGVSSRVALLSDARSCLPMIDQKCGDRSFPGQW